MTTEAVWFVVASEAAKSFTDADTLYRLPGVLAVLYLLTCTLKYGQKQPCTFLYVKVPTAVLSPSKSSGRKTSHAPHPFFLYRKPKIIDKEDFQLVSGYQ